MSSLLEQDKEFLQALLEANRTMINLSMQIIDSDRLCVAASGAESVKNCIGKYSRPDGAIARHYLKGVRRVTISHPGESENCIGCADYKSCPRSLYNVAVFAQIIVDGEIIGVLGAMANDKESQGWLLKSGSWCFGDEVIKVARTQLGGTYSYVGSGYFPKTKSYNCSGLTWWVYHTVGYDVSHNQGYYSYYGGTNKTDSTMWQVQRTGNWKTNPKDLVPGDLVFFSPVRDKWRTGHVGIYIGNNKMIHSWPTTGVSIADIYKFSNKNFFVGGGLPL